MPLENFFVAKVVKKQDKSTTLCVIFDPRNPRSHPVKIKTMKEEIMRFKFTSTHMFPPNRMKSIRIICLITLLPVLSSCEKVKPIIDFAATLITPAIAEKTKSLKIDQAESKIKTIHIILKQADIDAMVGGDESIGYPVEIKATDVAELERSLVKGDFIKSEEWDKLVDQNMEIGNVSTSDPDDTIIAYWSDPSMDTVVLGLKNGEILKCKRDQITGTLPPRTPNFLTK